MAVEEEDIADLKAALRDTTAADATRVLTNLLRGSENHLAAFTAYRDGKTPEPGTRGGMMQGGHGRWGETGRPGAGAGRGLGAGAPAGRPADCPVR